MHSVNRDELGFKDWSSKGNNSNREGDSTEGFSVLDTMLKRSLDRLKSMRFVQNFVSKIQHSVVFVPVRAKKNVSSCAMIDDFNWHMIAYCVS